MDNINKLQRDILIDEIIKKMSSDKNTIFCSADFGAKSLDHLRNKFKKQFIHCGISEQAMFDVATGLALDKKKIFVYAMAPFISLRALEQIKCGPGIMNLPVSIISVGVGLGYANAGPTHYACEDYICLRAIPNINIFTFSDNTSVKLIIKKILKKPIFSYLRLDREFLPDLSRYFKNIDSDFRVTNTEKNFRNKIVLVSNGYMTHECLKIKEKYPSKFEVIDLIKSFPISKKIKNYISKSKKIVCVDEQIKTSSISNTLSSFVIENSIKIDISCIALPNKNFFENIGRKKMLKKFGLLSEQILKKINFK